MKPLQKPHLIRPISLLIIDLLLFGLTDPNSVPSFMLIVAYLLLVASIFWLFLAATRLSSWYGLNSKHPKRLALVVTGVIGFLLALQSVGELTTRDMLILTPLMVVGYLYMTYGQNRGRQSARA